MAILNVTDIRGRRPGYDYSHETVTPDMATQWLALNTHNRRLSKATVARYARDMQAGAWSFTADPIRFNGKGALVDGQHRLHACVSAGVPFETLVVRGLPMELQEKLDQGKNRSIADHLTLREFGSAVRLAATARQLTAIRDMVQGEPGQRTWAKPTNAELMALIERHPNLVDSVDAVGNSVIGAHPSLISAIHYVGAHILKDRDTADSFVGVFATGEPTFDGDPAHLWRERVIAQETKKARLRRTSLRIGTIHAWNMFRRREPLKIFRIPEMATIDGLDVKLI